MSGDADTPWWLNQTDAARCLGVTVDMLRSMIRAGQLHPIRIGGRRVLRRSEVEALRDSWAPEAAS